MRAVEIIRAKRDGEPLSRSAVEAFVTGVTDGSWPDYQISALLMAIVLRGMSDEETAWLTEGMARSGARFDLQGLPGRKVDKHSTGGVGDKTALVLAPLAMASGVVVPMMCGVEQEYVITTLEKLSAVPGFKSHMTIPHFVDQLFSGEEINAVFLFFRTLFALGLVGMGLGLFLEKPAKV